MMDNCTPSRDLKQELDRDDLSDEGRKDYEIKPSWFLEMKKKMRTNQK